MHGKFQPLDHSLDYAYNIKSRTRRISNYKVKIYIFCQKKKLKYIFFILLDRFSHITYITGRFE